MYWFKVVCTTRILSTAGADFIIASGELNLRPGDTEGMFEVTIINDSVFEGLQEFSAQLQTAESRVVIIMPDTTVEIIDDDGKTMSLMHTHIHYKYSYNILMCFQLCSHIMLSSSTEIVIRFNPTSYTVTEGGSVQLILQKINTTEQSVTVLLATQQGTAGCKTNIRSTDC